MTLPRVTVLMATYNQAAYLPAALESLRAQTSSSGEVEVLAINDGSSDGTSAILHREAGWIRLVERENRGLAATCNEGLEMARGEYFARLDSDDLAAPEWLASLTEALGSRPTACLAYPDRYEWHGDARTYRHARGGDIYSLEACGTVFRTDLLRRAGGFRRFYWEEYDLYLRLRESGDWLHVAKPLYTYRKHDAGMTHNRERRIEGWQELIREWGPEVVRNAGRNPELEQVLAAYR